MAKLRKTYTSPLIRPNVCGPALEWWTGRRVWINIFCLNLVPIFVRSSLDVNVLFNGLHQHLATISGNLKGDRQLICHCYNFTRIFISQYHLEKLQIIQNNVREVCMKLVQKPTLQLLQFLLKRARHICASKRTVIGSDNGLAPGHRQAIAWTNAGILSIGLLGTNFKENFIVIHIFSFKKSRL